MTPSRPHPLAAPLVAFAALPMSVLEMGPGLVVVLEPSTHSVNGLVETLSKVRLSKCTALQSLSWGVWLLTRLGAATRPKVFNLSDV